MRAAGLIAPIALIALLAAYLSWQSWLAWDARAWERREIEPVAETPLELNRVGGEWTG